MLALVDNDSPTGERPSKTSSHKGPSAGRVSCSPIPVDVLGPERSRLCGLFPRGDERITFYGEYSEVTPPTRLVYAQIVVASPV